MKFKLATLLIVNLIFAVVYTYYMPGIQSDAAMNQLENGMAGVRAVEQTENYLRLLAMLINAGLVIWILYSPVTTFLKEKLSDDDEE